MTGKKVPQLNAFLILNDFYHSWTKYEMNKWLAASPHGYAIPNARTDDEAIVILSQVLKEASNE